MNFYYCLQCNSFFSLTDEQKDQLNNVCRCSGDVFRYIYTDNKVYNKDRTLSVAQLMQYLKDSNGVIYKGELITIKQLDDLILLESL